MVGRDIGTVVLPEAEVKIYLDADITERARRRHLENLSRGQASTYDAVLQDLQRRDQIDSTRAQAPLRAAGDAIVVDNTEMSVEQVVACLESLVREAPACAGPSDRACP